MEKVLGQHFLVELQDCDAELLKRVETVEPVLLAAAKESGATIISSSFHQFSPEGVTGVILIAESHIALHTWPEHGYAGFDIFTCGESMKPELAIDYLKEKFQAKNVGVRQYDRGC